MTFTEILSDLRKKIYQPVYFLFGDEPYYIDEIASYIEQNVLTEDEKEFNQFVLYGRDTDIETILSYCRRYPVMASHMVILVREAQELESLESLETYLDRPVTSTILVVCYKYKKIDGRTALANKLKSKAVYFESAKLLDYKTSAWIQTHIAERGLGITPKASEMLAEYLGNDLGKIVNEVDKLAINLREGGLITETLIEQNIGISKDYNLFEFQKALGAKNIYRSNLIAGYYAANPKGNHMQNILPGLNQYFVKLLIFHQLKDKSDENAARVLGIRPFFVKEYRSAAQHYGYSKCTAVISLLRQYDMKAKGVDNESTGEDELFKELVYKILH